MTERISYGLWILPKISITHEETITVIHNDNGFETYTEKHFSQILNKLRTEYNYLPKVLINIVISYLESNIRFVIHKQCTAFGIY